MTASVPVLQALELVLTWLPRPSLPAMRALLPLDMICSTMVLPSRFTRPAWVRGARVSAIVSMPPMPVPMIAPVSQSGSPPSSPGRSIPASVQASTAATAA